MWPSWGGAVWLAAGYYLGKKGIKTAIFERRLSVGEGCGVAA
jgi:ribulose 1,5-bisphosphate synthetase/thiazole synthase